MKIALHPDYSGSRLACMTGKIGQFIFVLLVGFLLQGVADAKLSEKLLAQMDADDFKQRNEAYKELEQWAHANLKISPEQLYQAWKTVKQPEVRSRCYELMKDSLILRKFGKGRGFIGIHMQETIIREEGKEARVGVMVTSVQAGTAGEKAGLQMNDIILGVDKMDFAEIGIRPNQLQQGFRMTSRVVTRFGEYIQSKQPGDEITLYLKRGNKRIDLKVILMKRPPEADMDALGRRLFDREKEKRDYFNKWLDEMRRK